MTNIINWERAPVTSNIAVTIPRANYPELLFAIEDDHGNVISCKDGAILSDFTVIERRSVAPAVETDTQDDDLWAVHEYESRGLVVIAGDRIIPGTVMGKVAGIVVEFAWRHCEADQRHNDYKGEIEVEGEYWRPVLVRWQKPGPAKTPEVVVKVGDAVSLDVISQTGDSAEVSVTDRVELTDEQIAKFKETWTASCQLNKGGVVAFVEMFEGQKEQLHGISGQHPAPLSVDILNQAIEAQRDRAATYDSPAGERSMGKTVTMFNILHGFDLTEEQGWQFMELLKMVRSSQGDFKLDNYVDGSSYASLAGDAAYHERGEE